MQADIQITYAQKLHIAHLARLRRIEEAARKMKERAAEQAAPCRVTPKPLVATAKHEPLFDDAEWRKFSARYDELKESTIALREVGFVRTVSVDLIQRVTAQYYKISKKEMLADRRTRKLSRPRQIAMYLAKTMTMRSLPEIGRFFANRDHTTILHGVRKIERLITDDPSYAFEINQIRRAILLEG